MEQDRSNNKNVSLSLIAEYGGSDSDTEESRTTENDSDATELSEMVLKNNIINACAHGPLTREEEEDEDYVLQPAGHMIIDPQSGDVDYEVGGYREDNDSSSSSSDSESDSEVDSVKDVEVEEVSSGDEESGATKASKLEAPKVNGEVGIEELPPIEDLAISLPEQETTKIGTVSSIVEQLVIVKATPGSAAVDLETVLFLDKGAKALGKVFDVFGPVTEPHYAVRFNSAAHVTERGVAVDMDVYIAPQHSAHTTYVFLPDLMKIKGSDASWKNDIEPPPSQVEYSDDEEERRARRAAREKHLVQNEPPYFPPPSHSGENSKPRKPDRRHRPSESSSRFGSAPSRGRNPFSAGSRRNNTNNTFPRFVRPYMEVRTPPHPNDPNQFGAPPNFPMFPPFNPNSPPPFMYQYRMGGPMITNGPISNTMFGSPYCNMTGSLPPWVNSDPPPPPPPGT